LGWGPGQFESLYRLHAVPQNEGGLRFDHSTLFAHNDYLQMAAGAGFPALAALLWALIVLLRAARQEKARIGPVLAGGAVFAFFNFPFALPVNALLAGGAAALAAPRMRGSSPRAARAGRRALALFLAFVSGATVLELPAAFRAGPPERAFYGRSAAYLENGKSLLLSRKEGESLIGKALRLSPGRAENWQAWATALALRGRMDEAVRALGEALRRHPKNAVWWTDLGLWRLNSRELSEAAGSFHEALRAEPRCFAAALFLGRTIRLKGEPEKALHWLTMLQEAPSGIAPDPASLSPYARAVLSRDEPALRAEIAECRKDIIRNEVAAQVQSSSPTESLSGTRAARGRSLDQAGPLAEAGRPSRPVRDSIGDFGPEQLRKK
jgi:cytochrome c-type biogenesis protein CcmH/NrfG